MSWLAKTLIEAPLVYKKPNKKIEKEQMQVLNAWQYPDRPSETNKDEYTDETSKYFSPAEYEKEMKKYKMGMKKYEMDMLQYDKDVDNLILVGREHSVASDETLWKIKYGTSEEEHPLSARGGFPDAIKVVAGTIAIMDKYLGSVHIQAAAIRFMRDNFFQEAIHEEEEYLDEEGQEDYFQ